MNKILIPALLVATIMVAGAFAFVPVEQASTVHLSGTVISNELGSGTTGLNISALGVLSDEDGAVAITDVDGIALLSVGGDVTAAASGANASVRIWAVNDGVAITAGGGSIEPDAGEFHIDAADDIKIDTAVGAGGIEISAGAETQADPVDNVLALNSVAATTIVAGTASTWKTTTGALTIAGDGNADAININANLDGNAAVELAITDTAVTIADVTTFGVTATGAFTITGGANSEIQTSGAQTIAIDANSADANEFTVADALVTSDVAFRTVSLQLGSTADIITQMDFCDFALAAALSTTVTANAATCGTAVTLALSDIIVVTSEATQGATACSVDTIVAGAGGTFDVQCADSATSTNMNALIIAR